MSSDSQVQSLSPNNQNNPFIFMFESLRRSSTKYFLSSHTNTPHNSLVNHDIQAQLNTINITTPAHHLLIPILHDCQGFFSGLIDGLEALTAPDTFNGLMAGISRFTDDSLDSIANNASATLRELSLLAQTLDKDLEKARVFARRCNVIFSTFVIGVAAAVVSPPLGIIITVGPWLKSIDPLWSYAMENPIKEKQKAVETMRFIIHSAIVKLGEIKDLVGTLRILVAELRDVGDVVRRFSEVEKAVADVLKEVKMAELEFPLCFELQPVKSS